VKESPGGAPRHVRHVRHVIVIGSGIAGTAAGIAAATIAPSVIVLEGGTGASTLATGAIDHAFWQDHRPEARVNALSESAKAVLNALSGYVVPATGCAIVTMAGMVRRADGHDASLLDVARLNGDPVAVVQSSRPGWNAGELAFSWGKGYRALETSLLRHTDESLLPDVDLAARHDDANRVGWLAERLREALARAEARWAGVVLPPILGLERACADVLSQRVGLPCGEAVASPGGPAGLRFERARDRALSSAGVVKVAGRAREVEARGEAWRVTTEDGQILDAYAVVVATGGLIGGGMAYAPSEAILATALPSHVSPPIRLSLNAPLMLGARGRPLDTPGSLFGFAPESLARPFSRDALVETVGVLAGTDGGGPSGIGSPPGLFAAGDIVADVPRTWLGALAQGAQAGTWAAHVALSRAETASGATAAPGSATRL
jgi:glycerol-3-phosphate dehydrogenase subunit B